MQRDSGFWDNYRSTIQISYFTDACTVHASCGRRPEFRTEQSETRRSHGLDMAQWGLGMDDSGPEEVWTEGEPFKPLDSTPEAPGGRHRGVNAPRVFMKFPGDIVMELAGGPGQRGAIGSRYRTTHYAARTTAPYRQTRPIDGADRAPSSEPSAVGPKGCGAGRSAAYPSVPRTGRRPPPCRQYGSVIVRRYRLEPGRDVPCRPLGRARAVLRR